MNFFEKVLAESPVIAVLVIDNAADAVPLAEVLVESGVGAMELTLRTPAALDALRAVRQSVPGMIAGVGTVLTPAQVNEVKDAGAAFAVAPGFNPDVLRAAESVGLPFVPGVATPTDVEAALAFGCRIMKFFPAEPSGGLSYLKSMAAPYAHLGISFIPLGGINEGNFRDYLESYPLVAGVGGSWIAPRELIAKGDWKEIARRARTVSSVIKTLSSAGAKNE